MTTTIQTAKKTPVTVAYGDGIGPEIMTATLRILEAAGARLDLERIEIGESVYNKGLSNGIEPSSWESLRRTKVFLKAPDHDAARRRLQKPQRHGAQDAGHVRQRTAVHVAASRTLRPNIRSMDVVIVRENEEDVYGGIEHRQTNQVAQCLKLISRPGSKRIIRYAFEYARANKRKKVTCFTKDNIMKITDGLFHRTFNEIATEYPEIENEHWIVDIGAAKMADTPEAFDVIVMPNLYGDVLSDVAAQITGSVGLAGSANIGDHCSMFEAIHGSAPRRAGQNLANPSGLASRGDPHARAHRPSRRRRARAQRVAAHDRRRRPHLRHLQRRHVAARRSAPKSSPTPSSRASVKSRSISRPVEYDKESFR